jgi:L-seryl-tRNA(Ser) seleniumtransferase
VDANEQYRLLPAVDELVTSLENLAGHYPRRLIVEECRAALEAAREKIRAGGAAPQGLASQVKHRLDLLAAPSFRRVINATGVILHTNLGRAPLSAPAGRTGYSNLEYDLGAGRRGQRDAHTSALLERLLGKPAILVNNGAAAVWLVLHELAAGGEVIVSRGELIEIGDGFRIPDIMARSGARLVEVGTTNKTRLEDYQRAMNEQTRLILRVHPSNFRIEGFAGRPRLEELATLGLPVYEDLGSGCFVDLRRYGVEEPTAQASLAAGTALVSFSGDKLLGGPQAGVIAGAPELIRRVRRNPMYRALRVDKLTIGAMEAALRHLLLEQWDQIPVLRMIRQSEAELRLRAGQCAARIPGAAVERGESLLGGGSTPMQSLPTWLIALDGDAVMIDRRLRAGTPPVVARIENEKLLLDLRTVAPDEEEELLAAVDRALG